MLQPALYEVGRSWAVGDFSVADEHSATAVTQSVLGMLGPRMRTAPKDGRLAVVTGSPEERHALGVQMVADFLEGDGWEVLNLGASTPGPRPHDGRYAERPDVVARSTGTPPAQPGAAEAVALRERLTRGRSWCSAASSGGAAPARTPTGLGADLVVDDPRELVACCAERFPPLPPDVEERGWP